MDNINLQEIVTDLLQAEQTRIGIQRITHNNPHLSIGEAYQIQDVLTQFKLSAGYKIVGKKMGLTNQAQMKRLKVDEPTYGHLFNNMIIPNGETVHLDELIQPRIEAEIAFVLMKDLQGPNITIEDVMDATDYVLPVLEILDFRYQEGKFLLPDVIADNASASKAVLGTQKINPLQINLDHIRVTLTFNEEMVSSGSSESVLGHPAQCVAELANMLAKKGERIKAGEVILTGGITEAVKLISDTFVEATFEEIGQVSCFIK